jgi:putative oxidoreductase
MTQALLFWTTVIGRWGLASLFILGALNKVTTYSETATRMDGAGLSPAFILLPLTILLEGVGGLLFASGTRFAPFAGLALAVFALATNVVFHRFWEADKAIAPLELSLFFKNVAIAGALLCVSATLLRDQALPKIGG